MLHTLKGQVFLFDVLLAPGIFLSLTVIFVVVIRLIIEMPPDFPPTLWTQTPKNKSPSLGQEQAFI
jgi:hypothetical protein